MERPSSDKMIPGGMDPKKMDALMRQMGIKSEPIEASSVVIETASGKIIIDQPQVVQVPCRDRRPFR